MTEEIKREQVPFEYRGIIGRTLRSVQKVAAGTVQGERIPYGAEDDDGLVLEFHEGLPAQFITTADCCSHTWIEELVVPNDINGAVVLRVSQPELREDEETYGDVVRFYATRFHTTKGDVTVEYRNSSNGYYGGALERVWQKGEAEALEAQDGRKY